MEGQWKKNENQQKIYLNLSTVPIIENIHWTKTDYYGKKKINN